MISTSRRLVSRLRIVAALSSAFLYGAACSDSSGPEATMVGTYTLTTIDGATLPVTIADQGITVKVSGGNITLNSSNRFTRVTTFTVTGPTQSPVQSVTCEGTYLRILNTGVVFKTENSSDCAASSLNGSWDIGHTLELDQPSAKFVYKK